MKIARGIVFVSVLFAASDGSAVGTSVPGSANPNLAGRDVGYSCCGGDSSPLQLPPMIEVTSCSWLQISATGKVSYLPGAPTGNNPDGDDDFSMTNYGDGIAAAVWVRTNALVGVFLDNQSPTGKPTPGTLDFSDYKDAPFLGPGLRQIFFIGDGLTSDSKTGATDGMQQTVVAPFGATRLYLGTVDGEGWYNNSGSFSVSITSKPENRPLPCGDPSAPVGQITSSDALTVLRTAVGTASCSDCVCDTDQSGTIATSDALRVLRKAVGQPQELACLCCCCPS